MVSLTVSLADRVNARKKIIIIVAKKERMNERKNE